MKNKSPCSIRWFCTISANVMRLGAGGKSTPNNQINNPKIKTQTDD